MRRRKPVFTTMLLLLTFMSSFLSLVPPAQGAGDASITSLTPDAGSPAGGYTVVVVGSNFDALTTVKVQLGTSLFDATVLGTPSSTRITFIMPDVTAAMGTGEQKSGVVVVTNSTPSSDTKAFTFYADPAIDGYKRNTDVYFIRDAQGNVIDYSRESQLILTGQRLNQPVSLLRLGGITVPLTDILESDYSFLRFKVPASFVDGQVVDVHLETQYGAVVDFDPITLYPTPDITNISRTEVLVGSSLEVWGRDFADNSQVDLAGGLVTVTIGGVDNEVNAAGTWIKIKVPTPLDSTTGKKDLRITLPDLGDGVHEGQMVTLKSEIEILPTPGELEITTVTPNSGSTAGGTVVQVAGRGFQSNMEVWFGSSKGTNVTVVTPPPTAPPGTTILQVTTPAGPPVGGPVNVYVKDPVFPDEVYAVLTNGFTYTLVSEALYVGTISPDTGMESGGTTVTVRGRNFLRFRSDTYDKYLNGLPFTYPDDLPLVLNCTEIETVEETDIPDPYNPALQQDIVRTLTCTVGGQIATIKGITQQPDGTWLLTILTPAVTLIPRAPKAVNVMIATTEEARDHAPGHDGAVIPGLSFQEQEAAENQFTYTLVPSAPEIGTVIPGLGSTAGGTTVVIDGWDFQSDVEVYFGTRTPACKATVQQLQYGNLDPLKNKVITTATVTTPHSASRGLVDVIVYNPTDLGEYTLVNGFEYISNPTITNISPAVSPDGGGVLVTVTGTDFLYDPQVMVGAAFGTDVRVYSSTGERLIDASDPPGVKLKFTTPPNAEGIYDVTIINTDTGTVTRVGGITYHVAPADSPILSSITPTDGPTTGGTDFTISGSNFGGTIVVTFDGEPATGIQVSGGGTRITGKTPSHTIPEDVTVQVINLNTGGMGSLPGGFTYHIITSNPKITSFTPNHGTTDTLVHIVGSDFVAGVGGADSSMVYFGDTGVSTPDNDPSGIDEGECGIYVVSDTLIEVRVPHLGSAGDYTLKVVNPDTAFATASSPFHYQMPSSAPEIVDLDGDSLAIVPSEGSYTGGGVVLVEGYDFRIGAQVYLGSYPATVLDIESAGWDEGASKWRTILAFRVPAVPVAEVGFKDLVIINSDGGTAVEQGGFKYVIPESSPQITSVTPNKGSGTGGYDIEISGQDFRISGGSGPTVYIGTNPAELLEFWDSIYGQVLVVLVPASATSGPKPVVVVNPDGGTATLNNGFTYTQNKLTATKLIPDTADVAGDTVINLVGTGFVQPSTREVGGVVIDVPGTRVFMQTDVGGTMDEVELTGQADIDGASYDRVTVISDTHLRLITIEQGTLGTRTIRLLNPDGAQATVDVTIISPIVLPSISAIEPAEGTLAGGTLVTITGADFRPQVEAYVGVRAAQIVSYKEDGTEIVIRTPAGATSDLGHPLDIIVVNGEDGASCTAIDAWQYVQPQSQPRITKIEPNKGPTKGGTQVTITGDNFRDGAEVYFGTVPADEVVWVSYTTITCITPPQEAGAYDVVVRNPAPDYGEATLSKGFTYEGGVVPDTPTGFIARLIANRTIELTWDPLGDEGTYTYEIYATTSEYDIDDEDEELQFVGSTEKTRYLINKVKEDTDYYFLLHAVGTGGASTWVEADPYPLYVDELNKFGDDYEDEDEDDDRKPSAIDLQRDSLNITVGTRPRDVQLQDYLILTDIQYEKVTQVRINVPYSLIKPGGRAVYVDTVLGNLDFFQRALYTSEMVEAKNGTGWASGSGGSSSVYGRLILRTLNPAEVERATAKLGPGYQVVGGVELLGEVQAGTRVHTMGVFKEAVNLTIKARPRQWSGGEPGDVYYFDTSTRSWVKVFGYTNPVLGTGRLSTLRPGKYALIIKRS